mgnify:CR=1 FL=1|jgi:tape measure domain-containing protein|uniref:Tail tape measure protein n=1 Tax=Myoviridae sp. ctcPl3 TaxID=2826669 RepID=A0A8S5QWJ1_9CAUD|nr:MAG TPA: tail tape measure protein [Myoviridae sp. ctcPl3]
MTGIHFDITGDNSNFMRKLQEAENGIRAASRQIEESGTSIEALFNRMTRAAAVFGAGFTAKELISDIVKVRGEFQQLEVAFNTMLGSKEKANALMSQLVRTAAVTPFDLQGVANGAKQLLAYGAAAEDVNETLIRIGNIAAGLSQPLSDLVYLYGTTMTQGRLYTQDLNQFTGRGIPMIRELANVFGVAEGEVKGLVEAGKVGFPEVQKVIHNLTNEGGMFYNLMQEQSKTITGQISNIEDAIATMFNEIGQANEGIINDALSGVGYLVENWESVAIAIESAAIAYGTYKAATMTAAALQGAEQTLKVDTEIEGLRALLIVKEESKNADIAAAVASGQLTESKAAELVVLREELALKISTLEAENTLAEKEYANALLSLDAADNRLRSAQDAVDGIDDWIARAEDLGDAELANTYRIQLAEKSIELQSAAIARNSAQKALNDAATKKKATSEALNTVTTQANTVANNVNTASMNIMKSAAVQLTSILKGLWASLMANPLLLVAGAFVGLGYAIYQVATAESEAERVIRETNNALEVQKNHYEEIKNKASSLSNTLSDESKSVEERFIAYQQLKRLMPEVFKDMDWETAKRKTNTELIKLETDELLRQQRIGLKTKVVMSQQKIQGLENSIIRTENRGGYAGALKEDLAAAKKELEIYQETLEDFEKAKEESKKESPVVYNKTYWETKKKEAQEQLDALTDIEAASSKGAALKAKINEYDKKINAFSTNTTKQENQAKKLRQQQEKITELERKQSIERQRKTIDLENQAAQAKINAMTDGYEKEKAQRDLNNKIEIQNVKRQKEDYIRAEIQAQKEIFDAKEDLKAKQSKGYVKKIFDASTVNVDEIIAAWDKIVAHTEIKQGLDEWQEREDAMNKYLMGYGTFSQKKAAIDKKFQDDINKETSLGAKNALQKQWNEAISSLKVDKLKQEINWEMVFGDLSNASKESLDKIKKQLKEFRESQEYQSMDIDQKKIIDESLNKIQTTLIDKGGLLGGLPEQLDALRIAQEELIKAQEEYNDALKNGTESEQEAALIKKNNAEKGVQNAQTNVSQSAEKATSNVATLANVITDLGSNSQMSLSQVGQLAGTLADTFSESGKKIGGIISAIFSALDSIGEQGLDGFLGNIFDSIFNAAYGAWDTVFGWTGLDFGGESDPQLQKDIENLTQSNQDLEMAIDNLADKMESTSVVESTEVYNQQKSNLEQQMRNTQEMMRRSAEAYSNGFLGMGGSHSSNKKINNAMSSSDWARISGVVGHTVNNASDFWNLTSEQMAKVALEATDLYTKIKNSADDGYRDAAQYMDSYISYYKELEELQNAYYEKLTSTSFDSVKDNFRTSLLEMKDNAEAFTEDFEEMMQNALLEIMMTGVYDKKLQEWYTNFAKSVESDKKLTPEEMEASKQDYLDIVEEAKAEWENYQKMFGWSDSTSDSTNDSFDSFISQMESSLNSLELTAKGVSDNIYDYFRQAMINALYEKEYKSKMEELYKSFEDLSADGLSESDMVQLGSQVDQYIEQMMKGVEDVNSLFADKLKDNEDLQSFVDNVKSAMSSIEATAEDVTDNIFEYIRQQMVEKMFADTFQPQIEEFYKKVQEAMSDGDITDAEKDALRNEAEKLANDIVAAKDILSDTLGITSKNLQKELEEEFKSFSDGILNSLYNAEVTAESVAKDIAESMRKELIEAMYIEQYEPRIKAIWEKWKEYSADGLVTDEERANIKADIDEIGKEVADAAKEISDAWKDSGEEVKKAFESFSDSIKSVLYGAEATAEDVANNIYQYMRNALVDSMFTAQLQPQIQAWYDKYTEFMKDGAIDTAERKTLDEMIAEIQKAGVDIVDAANALFPTLDTGAIKRAEEAAQEAENARNEAEQEWESFSDSILDSLYDIEATAEDISDDMSEYMRKALIKAMYVENFKPQMQKWYNEWQKAMGDDNLTSEEKQLLDSMKQTMVDDMKKEVDAINQFFGTMFSQQASSKGFEAMSQDTGEELNGRFTALNESSERIRAESAITNDWLVMIYGAMLGIDYTSPSLPLVSSDSDIKNSMLSVITSMNSLVVSSSDNNGVLNEIRNIMLLSNGYLEDISTYTKKILDEFSLRLSNIDRNTQNW